MALVKVASLSQLRPGDLMQATHEGQSYAVCNVAGEVHAIRGECPHLGGPLGHGALHGHTIVCPWHAWEFDCRTGDHTIAVAVDGDDVFLDLA